VTHDRYGAAVVGRSPRARRGRARARLALCVATSLLAAIAATSAHAGLHDVESRAACAMCATSGQRAIAAPGAPRLDAHRLEVRVPQPPRAAVPRGIRVRPRGRSPPDLSA
jgi:hypothetical protein